jgi:oxalate decarboxylase/phosphoglucose isomerase-like protein (cupin superfamily)
MRRLFLIALVFGAVLTAADDRIRIDNGFVRVIQAEVQPHVKGALHRHEFNRVIVALDAGELTVISEDGRKDVQHWKAGQVDWSPVTGMHTSENTGAKPFRLVEVEIKRPAPAAPPVRQPALDPVALDPRHNILLFDNPQVRVFRSWREPGGSEKMHEHAGSGRLVVLLTDLDARVKMPDGTVTAQRGARGDVLWSGPITHATTNTGAQRFEMVVIEVK